MEIGLMLVASIMVYSALFATGYWIYGNTVPAVITTVIAAVGGVIVFRAWGKMK